jgi:tRNA threonylcarbamoyladenosine biosynthesis protein TsaE
MLSSPKQTAAVAAGIARLLKPGDAVFLSGQLGAGKTFFIRAACRELGVTEPVTSPSFTMAQTYEGRTTVHHLDLYRLAEFGAGDAIDFEPFFTTDAITFVEWPGKAAPYFPEPALEIDMEHVDESSRRIQVKTGRKELAQKLEELLAGAGD